MIRRCPFFAHGTTIQTPFGIVPIVAYQPVVWVSLRTAQGSSAAFPAVVDSGHSHYFSIREEQLTTWAGLPIENLDRIGRARVNQQQVDLFAADLVLWKNVPGSRDELREQAPALLKLPGGIVVHTRDDISGPRLPLLGLRTLVANGLRLTFDGASMTLDIRKTRPR
jgi:hypothetical protein